MAYTVAETFVFTFFIFLVVRIIDVCGSKSVPESRENAYYHENLVPERNA